LLPLLAQVVKTRMQVQNSGYGSHRYTSFSHALTTIVKKDGVNGLYRGFAPTMFREIPFSSIQFAVYGVFNKSSACVQFTALSIIGRLVIVLDWCQSHVLSRTMW
jgi:solute carrier family 25 S-adenosylmethionine transporter 26